MTLEQIWNKVVKLTRTVCCLSNRVTALEEGGGGGGDFIPLAGTTVGNPVTGDITSNANLYVQDFASSVNGGIVLQTANIAGNQYVAMGDIDGINNGTILSVADVDRKILANGRLQITSPSPTLGGIEGDIYYEPKNYLSFAQMQDVEAVRPYKVYTALLTQSGTSAPVATVLENTLGGTPVWSYIATGNYEATLVGTFINNKTTILLGSGTSGGDTSSTGAATSHRISDDVILMTTRTSGGLDDDVLFKTTIEIRVYP